MVVKHTKPGAAKAAPASEKETAANQRRTRRQHAQERAQDYVEAIADLISAHGEARATDLARSLGVTHVTVIRTVQRLQRNGLVTSLPYRSIFPHGGRAQAGFQSKDPSSNGRGLSRSAGNLTSGRQSGRRGHRASRELRNSDRL